MGKHIILLHGALGSVAQLKELSDRLKNEYSVHTFNFMGHGGTEIPNELTMPLLVEQLYEFIEKNIPINDQLSIFGYSMGGYAALILASKNICKIDRIVTLGTKIIWNEDIALKEIKMLNPEVIEQKVPVFAEEQKNRHQPQDWKLLMKKTADMMLDLGRNNYLNEASFSAIQILCKLMIGEKDQMVTLDETNFAHHRIKGSELKILAATPHPIEKVDVEWLVQELIY